MHINAFYDLDSRTYTDALLQPVHEKDEFRAFRVMADRSSTPDGTSTVFIGDRGYASYNNMAHVIEKGQYFLFRTKDTASRGMAAGLGLPDTDTFDETVTVTIVRSRSKKSEISRERSTMWIKKHLLTTCSTAALILIL